MTLRGILLAVALAFELQGAAVQGLSTGPLSRGDFLLGAPAATAAAVAVAASPKPALASPSPRLPFVQHCVLYVSDMDETVKFWTEGLGMKVVREREVGDSKNVFVAYGPETLSISDGGYFSLELVKKKGKRIVGPGTAFQYIGLTLPTTSRTLAYQVSDAGGRIIPHWFAEKPYVEVASPDGIRVRINEGKRRDPVTVVAFGSAKPERFKAHLEKGLGMKDQPGNLPRILGSLAGDELLGYDRDGVSVSIVSLDTAPVAGDAFTKVAILTKDTQGVAASVEASPSGKVLFAGPVPGIGTKVANTIDDEDHGFVFVDYDDFEGELVPPKPAPAAESAS